MEIFESYEDFAEADMIDMSNIPISITVLTNPQEIEEHECTVVVEFMAPFKGHTWEAGIQGNPTKPQLDTIRINAVMALKKGLT